MQSFLKEVFGEAVRQLAGETVGGKPRGAAAADPWRRLAAEIRSSDSENTAEIRSSDSENAPENSLSFEEKMARRRKELARRRENLKHPQKQFQAQHGQNSREKAEEAAAIIDDDDTLYYLGDYENQNTRKKTETAATGTISAATVEPSRQETSQKAIADEPVASARYREWLRGDPQKVRDALVFAEILAKPLSLR